MSPWFENASDMQSLVAWEAYKEGDTGHGKTMAITVKP